MSQSFPDASKMSSSPGGGTAAYQRASARFREASALSFGLAFLHWDQSVLMPKGSGERRAELHGALAGLRHRLIADPRLREDLDEAEPPADATEDTQAFAAANLREMRRAVAHAAAVPEDLQERLVIQAARTEMVWEKAREADDFAAFAEPLETLLGLVREAAQARGEALGLSPYDALLDQYDPGLRASAIDPIFADLRKALPGLLDEVRERQAGDPPLAPLPLSEAQQKEIGLRLIEVFGFPATHGRLDESPHPFSSGMPGDLRITTRYSPTDPLSGFMAMVHETGHAMYENNLPADWIYQPVGEARGMSAHEAISLTFEMQWCRSRAFAGPFAALLAQAGLKISPQDLTHHIQRVTPGFIRVDADEVTYPLHVILRYELEQALLSGDLAVRDLPGAWQEGFEALLGLRPPTDREGCLQDVHWAGGAFGYFPTYALGACLASQIRLRMAEEIDLAAALSKGDLAMPVAWLKEHVFAQASLWETPDLVEQVTGKPLGADALLAHLRERYIDRAF